MAVARHGKESHGAFSHGHQTDKRWALLKRTEMHVFSHIMRFIQSFNNRPKDTKFQTMVPHWVAMRVTPNHARLIKSCRRLGVLAWHLI